MYQYKVSVVVPVYNTKNYLREMLDSLKNQTLSNFEVLLIDDGSTDGSPEYIKEYINENKLKNFRLVLQKNSGPSVARNKGISMSLGEYICFVDSDDKIHVNSLEVMYEKAITNNANIVLGGTYRFNSTDEWKINSHFFEEGFKDIKDFKNIFWSMGPCNKLYKRSLIKDIKFPTNLSYGEDQCFVMESYLKANKIYTIDKLVYYYREHEGTSCSLTSKERTNPAYVLKQVAMLWDMICFNIDVYVKNKYDANIIKANYLNRLVKVNIWIPLKNAIDSKDIATQINALNCLLGFLRKIDEKVFNEVFVLHRLCTAWIIDRYLCLDKKSREIYLEIVNYLFSSLDVNAYDKIRKKYPILVPTLKNVYEKQNLFIIRKYLFERKIKQIKKDAKDRAKKKKRDRINKIKLNLRNPVLKIGAIRGIDNNKLVLATNKHSELCDNLWYIEQKARELYPEVNIKFYGKGNRNLKDTIKMYWDFSNAKNIVVDDYYNPLYDAKLNPKINYIQVWHACGAFKKFGFSAIGYGDSNTQQFEESAHKNYTHIISSSEEIIPHYADAFGAKVENIKPIGVPRTDIFFDKEYSTYIKEKLKNKYSQIANKKVVLYAPTFRGNPTDRKSFSIDFDYKCWCKNIPEDTILIFKMHPSVAKKVAVPKQYSDRILDLSTSEKIEDLMILADVLISDYSSLVFEFALMDKPIIFYAYDLDDYLDERNFYYEYTEFVPSKIVKTIYELIDAVNNSDSDYDFNKLITFKQKFFDHFDGKSSERFCKEFIKTEVK